MGCFLPDHHPPTTPRLPTYCYRRRLTPGETVSVARLFLPRAKGARKESFVIVDDGELKACRAARSGYLETPWLCCARTLAPVYAQGTATRRALLLAAPATLVVGHAGRGRSPGFPTKGGYFEPLNRIFCWLVCRCRGDSARQFKVQT